MGTFYDLKKVKDIAQDDHDFIKVIVSTFLEEMPRDAELLRESYIKKDYEQVYQFAHKIKPTVDLFGLGVLDEIIAIQDWGRDEKKEVSIDSQINTVLSRINEAVTELMKKYKNS